MLTAKALTLRVQGALSTLWLAKGLKEAPSIQAISLYKYSGILQVKYLASCIEEQLSLSSQLFTKPFDCIYPWTSLG